MSRSYSTRRAVRRGNTLVYTVVGVVMVGAAALLGWWFFGRGDGDAAPEFITNVVSSGPYDFVVIEQGTVESATNVELRCEVRSRGGGGSGSERGSGGGMGGGSVSIIALPVPEGSMVEAGTVVVELDSSSLKLELGTQQTRVNAQKSVVVQAQNTLAAAEIARKEYAEGTFKQEERLIMNEIFLAKNALQAAQLRFDSAQRLAAKNLVTGLQLDGEQVSVDNARNSLSLAESKLEVLRLYTRAKMLKQFDSDIDSARAKVDLESSSLTVEEEKLADIQQQIEKCIIRAPTAGQVVYANQYDRFRGSSQAEFIVTEGAMVRERQVIVRLPNADDMQVRATVNEARVTLVRPGLPVDIRVDALKDEVIKGVITKVNQYAEAGGYSSGNIKRYATIIKILDPPQELRVGMNAEVRIHVERKQDALQVPVQALAEGTEGARGRFFSLVQNGDRFETREVKISSTNDKVATIESGLVEGDVVVMNPRGAGGLLELPDLPEAVPTNVSDIARAESAPVKLAANSGVAGGAPVAAPGGSKGDKGGGPDGAPSEGRGGGGGKKGKGGRGGFSPAMMVDRYLESDADKDGKLSADEVASLDDRGRQNVADADSDKDGFLNRAELMAAATAAMQRRMAEGGRGGRGGGGPVTGGGE
jgi:multidrug efflux pump subunit AcrA (membrane-fusion protein)